MTKPTWLFILGILIILIGTSSLIYASAKPLSGNGSPSIISYSGVVNESGTPYQGTGYLKFAVVNSTGTISYWSNDGTSSGGSEPIAGIEVSINDGLFHVLLGDTTITNMTAITASVFNGTERYMRIWFSADNITYTLLSPDNQISSVPYAFQAQEAVDADTVDGFHASQLGAHYQNLLVVAKSGGDFISIQAAIDSISDASESNPYLIWIAPGVYTETVTLKPHVHLEGAGRNTTILSSTVSNGSFPPTQATLVMATETSVNDMTIENTGTGLHNVALLNAGTNVLVENSTILTYGSGETNYALYLTDLDTRLRFVNATSTNASNSNIGLYNTHWSYVIVEGGNFGGNGGSTAYGIFSNDDVTTLVAYDSTAIGQEATTANYGLYNAFGSQVTLFSGFYTGRGGINAYGIQDDFELIANNILALGEGASGMNTGLLSTGGYHTEIWSGSYIGKEGTDAYGISVNDGRLDGYNFKSYAELGSNSNYGLSIQNECLVSLYGGSIASNGGAYAYGIYIDLTDGNFKTRGTTVMAEDGTSANYGLYNNDTVVSHVVGGSFSALNGTNNYGFYNSGTNALLEAQSLYVQGEFGTGDNYGIYNTGGASSSCNYCVIDGLTTP